MHDLGTALLHADPSPSLPVPFETPLTGIAIAGDDHVTRLKWHRLQRSRSDLSFTPRRLLEGLAAGASLEVDLRLHADHSFVCLHDATLDRETSGSGPVAAASLQQLRRLRLRGEADATGPALILLEDLAELARGLAAPDALIQLDLKETEAALDRQTIENFRRTLACIAGRCILSGGDWQAISRLADAVPAMRRGFDPCAEDTLEHLRDGIDCLDFVESTLATAPDAEMIYLDYRLILAAEGLGIDLVAPFRAAGKAVDAWTLNTDHAGAARSVKRLAALKVDQITTDEPDALQALFEMGRG
ncbi:glycerophosphodiester phosphodiesterase [Dongia sp.]|uniref:glycerophosphodiester phosphodiesterase n=1 Tax=Dongia sp. TaxID=1977262 RepID=UPI003752DDC9